MRCSVCALALLTLAVIVYPAIAQATGDVTLYNEGNKAYRDGEYEKAYGLYDQIKTVNPYVYYNKASAAYKSGLLGKAMVNLYRAERLKPGDKDIRENINFLKSIKPDREKIEETGLAGKLFQSLRTVYDMTGNSFGFLIVFTVAAILSIHMILAAKKESNKTMSILYVTLFFALLMGFITAVQIYQFEQEGGAVAIIPEVNAHAAPSEEAALVFTFHEATRVTIEKVEGDYAFVYVSSGLSGWVKRGALERI